MNLAVHGHDASGAGAQRLRLPRLPLHRIRAYSGSGRGGFDHNGSGAWSLVVTSDSDDVRVAAFSALGNPAAGFTALPVIDANAACP